MHSKFGCELYADFSPWETEPLKMSGDNAEETAVKSNLSSATTKIRDKAQRTVESLF